MAKGFGPKASKQSGPRKAAAKPSQGKQASGSSWVVAPAPKNARHQDMLCDPEQMTLAWEAGVFNPIDEAAGAFRLLEAEEEDWLFLAQEVGWLEVEDSLDAIYYTSPPPDFDEKQADWYVRPDLSIFLDEPQPLREVVKKYPISKALLTETFLNRTQALGWSAQDVEAFVRETVDNSWDDLQMSDYAFLLLMLQHQME